MIIPQDKCNCAIDVVALYSAICDDHTLSGAATIQNIKHVGIRGRIENIEYVRTSTYMKMHRQQCRVHGIDYSSSTLSISSLCVFDMLSSSCGNYCLCTPTTACMLYCSSLLQHISFLVAATALYSISSSRWKSRGHMHTCSWITTNRVHGFLFPRTIIRECPRYYVIIVCFFVYSRMFESHLRPMGPT